MVFLALVLCAVVSSRAVADVGLTPMHADVVAAPGGDAEPVELTVINTSGQPRTVRFTVEDFTVGDYGDLLFRHDLAARNLSAETLERHAGAAYVDAEEDVVDLEPFEERVVTFTVSLPQNARGHYFAMVRADAGVALAQANRGGAHNLRVRLQVGAFLFITAGWRPGREREDGEPAAIRRATPARYDLEVTDVRTEFPAPGDERQTLRVVAEVENRSTVYYIGDVTAVILNVDDRRVVERVRFSQGVRLVLPDSRRVYVGEVRSRLAAGTYRIRFDVDGDAPRLRDSYTTHVELMEPVAGLGAVGGMMRVLDVSPADEIRIGVADGQRQQRVRVYNNTDDVLRVVSSVAAAGEFAPGLRVAPRRFNIPPGGVRSVRVSARARRGYDGGIAELALMPSTRDGVSFPDAETRRLAVTVDARSLRQRRVTPR